MDGIRNTKDYEGSLRRKGQTAVRGIETSSRGFLDFTNPNAGFTDDGTDQNVWNEQAQRIGFGLCSRSRFKSFVIECSNDKTECLQALGTEYPLAFHGQGETNLCNRIHQSTDGQHALDSTSRIIANGAFGTRMTTNERYIFSALANDRGSFCA